MSDFVNPNLKVIFDGVEVVRGTGKNGVPYNALDVKLRHHSGTTFSHRLFEPREEKASKYKVNGFIKNMVEQLGGELPPSGFTFESFTDYCKFVEKELQRFIGVQIYVKMLKNNGWYRLGYTLPVFSNSPHMEWSEYEKEKITLIDGVIKNEAPINN